MPAKSEEMNQEDFALLSDEEKAHVYKCPECGEMVDKRQLDDVLFDEDHEQRSDLQYSGSIKISPSN